MGGKDDEGLADLGDLQREVVQVVWANAPVTAETVRERLSRPLKESTVRTVLRRLEEKGYITHTVDGRSEEHTSELQSPDHLLCRLLLEKQKKTRKSYYN